MKLDKFIYCFCYSFIFLACSDNKTPVDFKDDEQHECFGALIQAGPFHRPTVHPVEGTIFFHYMPVIDIEYPYGENCPGKYKIDDNNSGHWRMNPDGREFEKVLGAQLFREDWSPDGKWLAFGTGDLFKMPYSNGFFDTSQVVQLTNEGWSHFPAWSPDGEWIAYDRSLDDRFGPSGVYLMRKDGTKKRYLARAAFPKWHPSGDYIIASLNDDGTWYFLFIDPFNASEEGYFKKIKREPNASSISFSYSPNGDYLAMVIESEELGTDIWVADENAENSRRITTTGATRNGFVWLNNNYIIYINTFYNDWGPESWTLWKVNIHTGEHIQLTWLLHEKNHMKH